MHTRIDVLSDREARDAEAIVEEKVARQRGIPTFLDNLIRRLLARVAELRPPTNGEPAGGLSDVSEAIREYLRLQREPRFQPYLPRVDEHQHRRPTMWELRPMQMCATQGARDCVTWRGLPLFKSAFDVMLYSMLIWDLKPRTIVELGSGTGASAVCFADFAALYGRRCQIYSLDLQKPAVDHPGVTFLEGDCEDMPTALPARLLADAAHPWIVIEDVHVNVGGILRHVHGLLRRGDYLVVEDSFEKEAELRAVMRELGAHYAVDTHYVDFFGHNATCSRDSIFIRR